MGNVVLNKPIKQSSYVIPYSASRAVDGVAQPLNRWLSNTVPCNMVVDLQNVYYINGWNVINMSSLWKSNDYALQSYNLQVSTDGNNWTPVDSVENNAMPNTNKTFPYTKARFVKVNVTKGLKANPQVASIVELQVFGELGTSALLTNLVLSSGDLQPIFNSTTYTYTSQVSQNVGNITLTPTAQDSNATIKVNGVVVESGKESSSISLTENAVTPITIEVKPLLGDVVKYTVNVTRCGNTQLASLRTSPPNMKLTPTFSSNVYGYTITATGSKVLLTPTATDTNAKITVNGQSVTSGTQTTVNLNVGLNIINIVVTPAIGTLSTTYKLEVTIS